MVSPPPQVSRARFGRFEFDLRTGELWKDGAAVDLPPQPARLLALLIEARGALVPRSEIRERIWGKSWLEWEAGLHQAIRRIRVALDDSASEPRFVETLPRRGYRFVAEVAAVSRLEDPRDASAPRKRWAPSTEAWRRPSLLAALTLLTVISLGALRGSGERAAEVVSGSPGAEAHRLHREGLHLLDRGEVPKALERFRLAAELAPAWAAPWSAIGEAELARPTPGRVHRARAALQGALARDPRDGRAWRLLASLQLWEEWDWVGARQALDRALEIDPDSAESWQLAASLETVLGREAPALTAARAALNLDPISTARRVDLGWTLYYFDRPEEALAECRRSLEIEPESQAGRQCVVQALLLLGLDDQAATLLGEGAHAPADDPVGAYFRTQLEHLATSGSCSSGAAAAVPRFVLGDPEGALEALALGAEERRGWELPFARLDPLLASLRKDPRFERIEHSLRFDSGAPRTIL